MSAPAQIAAYEELFGRARRYNRGPGRAPTLLLDLAGYPYAGLEPGRPFHCAGCGEHGLIERDLTANCQVAWSDENFALGRRQAPIGICHDAHCAERAFERWNAEIYASWLVAHAAA
jgi:hypothetical protein